MMLQLTPTTPVETPQGKGQAHLVIDYGSEHNLLWVCFLDKNGECWTFQNKQITLQANPTMRPLSPIERIEAAINRGDEETVNAIFAESAIPADPDFAEVRCLRTHEMVDVCRCGDCIAHRNADVVRDMVAQEKAAAAFQPAGAPQTWEYRPQCKCEYCNEMRAKSRLYTWTCEGQQLPLVGMPEGYDPNKEPIYADAGLWARSPEAADKSGVVGPDVRWVVHDGCECTRCVLERAIAEGRVTFDDQPPESRRYRWTTTGSILTSMREGYDPNKDPIYSGWGTWVRSVEAENLRYRWTCGKRIIMGAPENYDPNHDRVFNRDGPWVRGPAHL